MYLLGAKILAGLAFIAALVYGWHRFTDHYRNQGREEVRAEWNADIERRREQVTAITLAWDQQRKKADEAGKVADDERAKRAAEGQIRARSLPAVVAGVVVPARALSVLDDAIRADQPTPTGPAIEPVKASPTATATATDSTVGLLTEWGVQVIALYGACRDQVAGWQAFYSALQAAQPSSP